MQRMTRIETWSYAEIVLANAAVAEKGHMACIELASGEATPGAADDTLLPVGYFDEDLTGDGTTKVRIRFFKEKVLHRWTNDANPNDVQASDIGNVCYVKDSQTVSTLATSRSIAGRVWGATASHVLVEMADTIGLQGPQGEPGA